MYSYLFYCTYSINLFFNNTFIKSQGFGKLGNPVFLMSLLFFVNISSIWLHFKLSPITTNYNLDATLVGLLFLFLNWLILIKLGKGLKIIEQFNRKNPLKLFIFKIITFVYILISFYLFYLAHSNYYYPAVTY
jgi:hypothetical protein